VSLQRKRIGPSVLIAFFAVLIGGYSAPADQTRQAKLDQVIDSLFAVSDFRQTAISPDGTRVAWVEWLKDKHGMPTANSAIYVKTLGSQSPPERITASADPGDFQEHAVAWSPDGRQLAFLSDAPGDDGPESSQQQFWLVSLGATKSGKPRRLTHLTGYLDDPHWSPSGHSLAFLFTENLPHATGPLEPMTPPSGEISHHIYEQRLVTVDADSGALRQLSPANLYVYQYDWSADGRRFVVTAAPGEGDANWWIAQLYTIDATSGATTSILKPGLQMVDPHWSPDGKSVAFIGGLMSDFPGCGDIYVVAAEGGEARSPTYGMQASACQLMWARPDTILFAEDIDGQAGAATVNPSDGAVRTLWTGPENIRQIGWGLGFSVAGDGRTAAVIRSSFTSPPEVWAGPIGAWRRLTGINAGVHPTWGTAESLHWKSDNLRIQGWLLYPRDYSPSRRYPLVVDVHGGPGWSHRSLWPESFFNTSALASMGYFVLYPNPRGSFGQGETFTRANIKDFGYGDLRDILAGVDHLAKTLPVDEHRVGITGWSYGGYMSMWAVTQTQQFAAAVAGAGIANWLSYYGENDIDR
jgi:dipeptidyl aminopeptidase/acylaminoacyl peptidase